MRENSGVAILLGVAYKSSKHGEKVWAKDIYIFASHEYISRVEIMKMDAIIQRKCIE